MWIARPVSQRRPRRRSVGGAATSCRWAQQEVRPIQLLRLTVPTRSGRTRKEPFARDQPARAVDFQPRLVLRRSKTRPQTHQIGRPAARTTRAMPPPASQSGSRLRQRGDCSCPTRSLGWIEHEKRCGIKLRAHARYAPVSCASPARRRCERSRLGAVSVVSSTRLYPECESSKFGSQGSTRALHPDPVSIGCALPPARHPPVSDTCTRLGRGRERVRNQVPRRTAPVRGGRSNLASG